MNYQPRCSRCGRELEKLIEEDKVGADGLIRKTKRRPGHGNLRWSISSPAGIEADGMGFNEYLTVRLAQLQLPLCLYVDGDELAGCFLELVTSLESWWRKTDNRETDAGAIKGVKGAP